MRRVRIAIAHSLDPAWGVAAVRIVMGLIFVTAGWSKIANGFGAVAANFGKMGMPAPGITGPSIALLELIGGALLLVGIAGRWPGLLFALDLDVATFLAKPPQLRWDRRRLHAM